MRQLSAQAVRGESVVFTTGVYVCIRNIEVDSVRRSTCYELS